jgi:hypothetical protein
VVLFIYLSLFFLFTWFFESRSCLSRLISNS